MTNTYPRLHLRLYLGKDRWIGPGKADLLALIAQTGSISAAGRAMGMSYKRAWGLVEGVNAMFDTPLVERVRGGEGGGGARLTPRGQEVLALYRDMVDRANDATGSQARALHRFVIPEQK